jgi:hypothetical protein
MRIEKLLALLGSVNFSTFPKFDDSPVLDNLLTFRRALHRLAEAEELREALDPLLKSAVFATDRDRLSIDGKSFHKIAADTANLRILVVGLQSALKLHAAEPSENAIAIKLPDPQSMSDAVEDMGTIQKAISQVIVNPTINGEIKLVAWEKGSFWLHLYLGSALAVGVIGMVAWAAAVVRKKRLEGSLIEKKVRGLEIGNDAIEALMVGLKKEIDTLVDAEALSIFDKNFGGEHNGEQIARVRYSINVFAELIARGAEVHPALYAPEAVKNLFPDVSKLAGIVSQIKQLEDAFPSSPPGDQTPPAT